MPVWVAVMAGVYALAVVGLFLHGVNAYVLIATFLRGRRAALARDAAEREAFWRDVRPDDLPRVTVQVPCYNERNVVERQIAAFARLDYPRDRFDVQILDDSTDDTSAVVADLVARHRADGLAIAHLRRSNRAGYKAGALAHGLERAAGEFLAIFDADFLPGPDFLRRTVPFFADPHTALVQARWGHLNATENLITRAQSVGIDGHFSVEQAGRAWGGYFLNFNGTAGVWRKAAIVDAGGWQADTLTEDLDLSYRAQLRGWRMKYLFDTVAPAEVPADINAFKSQQFRWAKGSIQSAMKNLPALLRAPLPLATKYQAIIHMTHYAVHPLMVLVAALSVPMLARFPVAFAGVPFVAIGLVLLASTFGPSTLYAVSQRALYPRWGRRLAILPALVCLGTGVAINNARAVVEALLGVRSPFVRTPKAGDGSPGERRRYVMPATWMVAPEFLLGCWSAWGVACYVRAEKYLIGPFLAIYSIGFLSVAILTLAHALRSSGRLALTRDYRD